MTRTASISRLARAPRSSLLLPPFLIALFLSVATASSAASQTVILNPSADATLYQEGDLANGAGQFLFTGRILSGAARRALLVFDLTAVPAGSTIESATLTLTVDRTRAPITPVTLHRLTVSWGEGDVDDDGPEGMGDPATDGSATWDDRFFPAPQWTLAGGDFVAAPSATGSAGDPGPVVFGGPGLAADLQAWLDDPSSNHGWILIGDETAVQTAKRLASRETAEPATAPTLVLELSPPPIPAVGPTVLVLLAVGLSLAGLLLLRRL